jgi:cyclopropane fatty-acyl-phospholipid synthase-like methyltransferase
VPLLIKLPCLYQLENAGFEMKSIDVLGVHYSATIYRWYKNWLANEDQVVEKYGRRRVTDGRELLKQMAYFDK